MSAAFVTSLYGRDQRSHRTGQVQAKFRHPLRSRRRPVAILDAERAPGSDLEPRKPPEATQEAVGGHVGARGRCRRSTDESIASIDRQQVPCTQRMPDRELSRTRKEDIRRRIRRPGRRKKYRYRTKDLVFALCEDVVDSHRIVLQHGHYVARDSIRPIVFGRSRSVTRAPCCECRRNVAASLCRVGRGF